MRTDVLIVGGGPAGLAAAIALRQRGATVAVADSLQPPIDKACGEGLMPDSLRELALLGVELTVGDGAAFRGIRFVNQTSASADQVATAQFPVSEHANSGIGIGLRRQTLHARLVARAQEAGVVLRWLSPVQLLKGDRVLVAGQDVNYGWLVGADGLHSRVRSWARLERGKVTSRRFGFRRHFLVNPDAAWSQYVEVHWSKNGQAYVTPTGPNEVCVVAVTRDPHCRLDQLLTEMPALRDKLGSAMSGAISGGASSDRERGAVTATRRLARVATDRVALVGDASGSADAITGEGMGMAFRQALLLAECLEAGDLARYNRLHSETVKLPQTMARLMLLMDRSSAFRDRALGMLAAEPALFAQMLNVHLGAESLTRFAAVKGLEVAWKLALPSSTKPARSALTA
jgi:flavin-dependent dehydrogenase